MDNIIKLNLGEIYADLAFYELALNQDQLTNDLCSSVVKRYKSFIDKSIDGLQIEKKYSDNFFIFNLYINLKSEDHTYLQLKDGLVP